MSADPEIELEDSEEIIGPIEGWREWALNTRSWPRLRLRSWNDTRWEPRHPLRARCQKEPHGAPVWECTCGIYAAKEQSLEELHDFAPVIGRVALWGKVIEHEQGVRGEYAYPLELFLSPIFNEDVARILEETYGVPTYFWENHPLSSSLLWPKQWQRKKLPGKPARSIWE